MPSLSQISNSIDPTLRSDKSEAYLTFYEELFGTIVDRPLNILEVGVFNGGSLLMFAEYFKNARILGVDIKSPPPLFHQLFESNGLRDRAAVMTGSQSDKRFMREAIMKHFGLEQIDIVIDDASHVYKHTKATFDIVFSEFLKSGGHYVIEDWGCGYWPKWTDGNPNGWRGLPRLVKELIDLTALSDRTRLFMGKRAMRVKEEQSSPIARMIVVPSIVTLVKV